MKLDPFYPIFDSAEWIKRLVPLGIRLVQLRMKDTQPAEVRRHLRAAKAVCAQHGCQLVVNDYWQLAIEEACDYIHLGQEDLAQADGAQIRRAGLKLGVSTHDEVELEQALAARPDYVALGPVYPTILKKMRWAPQGLKRISLWKQKIGTLPLVAIGGLTVDRLAGVFAQGGDSAGVVTDITLNENPENRVKQWIEATQTWR